VQLGKQQISRIKAIIDSYGLPSRLPPDINFENLIEHIKLDKKVEADQIKLILPERIGKVIIRKGGITDIRNCLEL